MEIEVPITCAVLTSAEAGLVMAAVKDARVKHAIAHGVAGQLRSLPLPLLQTLPPVCVCVCVCARARAELGKTSETVIRQSITD